MSSPMSEFTCHRSIFGWKSSKHSSDLTTTAVNSRTPVSVQFAKHQMVWWKERSSKNASGIEKLQFHNPFCIKRLLKAFLSIYSLPAAMFMLIRRLEYVSALSEQWTLITIIKPIRLAMLAILLSAHASAPISAMYLQHLETSTVA
jgi:hypothetical protein